jgi:hypothetical protein
MRILLLLFTFAFLSCAKKRTPEQIKALVIGRWETVTDNSFEVPYVFTDTKLKCEEFVSCGDYLIKEDSLIVFGVDTTRAKIVFKESDQNIMLVTKEWSLRLRKISDQE